MLLGVFIVFFAFSAVFSAKSSAVEKNTRLQASLLSGITKFVTNLFGPSQNSAVSPSSQQASAIDSLSIQDNSLGRGGEINLEENGATELLLAQDSALINTSPLTDENNDTIITYEVREGDTPSGIAAKFNISVNTLLWANDIRNPDLVRIGDNLIILPISGVKYTVKKGDTLASIAKKYNGDKDEIINFNDLNEENDIKIGDILIIPDGIMPTPPKTSPTYAVKNKQYASLPDLGGYFIRPTVGRISQGFHGRNGVDIANPVGTPIYAAGGGAVIIADAVGYNGGFGKYIVINHPNGTQTLYAHASRLLVSAGRQVKQGDLIAYMGSTGRSTGSHLHFEVHGARNPLLRY